ncbi:hypothetical protein [Rhodopseudomonas sp.]|uniref:hypothetical protein n=1 Tax=Rhodopseudomonas sp. TaxID=1078 RepID=UPI0039E5D764
MQLATTDGIFHFDPDEIEAMGRTEAAELDALLRLADRMFLPAKAAAIQRALNGAGMEPFRPVVDEVAKDIGVPVDHNTVDGRLMSRTILRGCWSLLQELQETVATIPRQLGAGAVEKPQTPNFPFLQHWSEFEKHKRRVAEWKADTAANARATARVFAGLMGEVTLQDLVSSGIASNFKAAVLQLPFGYDKKKSWRDTPITEVVSIIAAMSEKERRAIKLLSKTTADKHLSNLSEYWGYLKSQKLVSEEAANPFQGLHSRKKKRRAARDEHKMWPPELDQRFFSSSIYFGCSSIHRRFQRGTEIHRDALFWVPLIGRTSGARQDEICCRLVKDVEIREDKYGTMAVLKIRASKTDGSERNVPIHRDILDFGFLEYRCYGREPHEPLFPELVEQGPGDRRSAAFTGRFAYARQKLGLLQPGLDFRSYRDTFETVLRNTQGVNEGWIDELTGHDSEIRRSEGQRYTKVIYENILRDTVNKVVLPVDMAHLRYEGCRGRRAPGAAEEIARFVTLAEREMNKKVSRRH